MKTKQPGSPLTLEQARDVTADHEKIAALIGVPFEAWGGKCHAVSLALLRTGLVGPGRIARGWAEGIRSQHSWIVLGGDCYDPLAVVVDPTYYSWAGRPEGKAAILVEVQSGLARAPHGMGNIFHADQPYNHGGPVIELTPRTPLSAHAKRFLDVLGPLDRAGWSELAHSPVGGWPAAEIVEAMLDTRDLAVMVPVDIVGMLTGRNPKGLYR